MPENEPKRWRLLYRLEAWLEIPVILLGLGWLILVFVDLVWGLTSFLEKVALFIWIIFSIDFAVRFIIAPRKSRYLKHNWITALSLLVPAVRIASFFKIMRLMRLARLSGSFQLMKILGSLYRGMNVIKNGLSRQGFGYIIVLTIVVTLIGAAGMLRFEKDIQDPSGLHSYGEALWWTAMLMTTVGTAYWPNTTEGRILCFFLALYAFGIFGYITARFAAFIVGRDIASDTIANPDVKSLKKLHEQMYGIQRKLDILISENKKQMSDEIE